ncbi:FixH family protein [Salinicoccus hispanicus]|uniref:Uncharacterized protein n=1 Tax=Salinicoccus hispanicus TaxID=157225 RepID=A0A6N8U4V7_9STAP|nr:FixH family protein [Salinicoccus hispanicus]MXQ51515.1 hypothetical protein [Salinicoccus hispanicus]
MYRLLILILAATLLSACGSIDSETHGIYTEIPDISIIMDTQGISDVKEAQPLFIEVSENDTLVDDAEISLEVWRAVEEISASEVYTVSQRDDGLYEANVDIDVPGLYFAKAIVSAGNVEATPLQYFIVGQLNPQEHELLNEILPGDNEHTGGHH